jgi:hypothetical protein
VEWLEDLVRSAQSVPLRLQRRRAQWNLLCLAQVPRRRRLVPRRSARPTPLNLERHKVVLELTRPRTPAATWRPALASLEIGQPVVGSARDLQDRRWVRQSRSPPRGGIHGDRGPSGRVERSQRHGRDGLSPPQRSVGSVRGCRADGSGRSLPHQPSQIDTAGGGNRCRCSRGVRVVGGQPRYRPSLRCSSPRRRNENRRRTNTARPARAPARTPRQFRG